MAIVEDDQDYLYSLKKYLDSQDDIYVSLTTSGDKEALKLIIQDNPNVILMDINLNGDASAGINLTEVLTKDFEMDSKIIMLTGYNDNQIIYDSIKAGAKKYVVKSDIEKIPDIIRSTMEFNPDIVIAELLKNMSQSYTDIKHNLDRQIMIRQLQKLTRQQLIHLRLMLEGKTRNEMSSILGITFNTVKNTINSIYKALKVSREDLFKNYCINCVDELLRECDE